MTSPCPRSARVCDPWLAFWDTDLLIEVLRGRADDLRAAFLANSDRIAVSTVSVMELAFGSGRSADPSGSRAAVKQFLGFVTILDFDTEAAADSGELTFRVRPASAPPSGHTT